jgi:hypothetical protein
MLLFLQLFHIFGIMASYNQMSAAFIDFETRRVLINSLDLVRYGQNELFLVWVVLLANIVIIIGFIAYLLLYDGAVSDGPSDLCRKTVANYSSANNSASDEYISLSKID